MRKKLTGQALCAGALLLGVAAVGCGGAIESAPDGWVMLGWTVVALVLMGAALVLAALGVERTQETEPPRRRVHREPKNTVTTSHRFGLANASASQSSPDRGAGKSRNGKAG